MNISFLAYIYIHMYIFKEAHNVQILFKQQK